MFMTLAAQPGMTSLLEKPSSITRYRRALEVGYQPDIRNALANIIRFTLNEHLYKVQRDRLR